MKPTPETDAEERYFNTCSLQRTPELKNAYAFARKLERERDEARSGSNVQCNTAWLETLERSNCYLTTDGRIVQRNDELDQLRKVADELALGIQRNDLSPLKLYSQLPHVKQKETK